MYARTPQTMHSKLIGGKDEASLNSCAWSQDLENGDPLLCVSGQLSSIKVLNVKTGQLIRV